MATTIPTELLRSLVSIVETGSIADASKRVFLTPSAVSLQMKRLEDILQVPLFDRIQRRLRLTTAGELMLAHAREVIKLNDEMMDRLRSDRLIGPARVGIVQDLADELLSGVLSRFAELNTEVELQVRVGRSNELMRSLAAGDLDLVLCLADALDPLAFAPAPAHWLGNASLLDKQVVPLAVMEQPCIFREMALTALDDAGLISKIVLETQSLSALRAAVSSGLGVTCYTSVFVDPHLVICSERAPKLSQVRYSLRTGPSPHATIQRLSELLKAATLDISSKNQSRSPTPRAAESGSRRTLLSLVDKA